MKKNFLPLLIFVTLCSIQHISYGQATAPDLGGARDFALFTASGAIDNTGLTVVTGDLGTDAGVISGFPLGVVVGTTFNADPTTASANADVLAAFASLSTNICNGILDYTIGLGHNQVLTPNVYCLVNATTLTDTLILDGQNNPDALFIFRVDGALSTSDFSRVILINSVSMRNVYFQVNGAFSSGANSIFKGTVIANGAINMGHGSTLFGRGLSTSNAINLDSNTVTLSSLMPLPVGLIDFSAIKESGQVRLKWSTATEQNSKNFTVERSNSAKAGSWETIGTLPAAGNSSATIQYSLTDNNVARGTNYYRLRSSDMDGSFSLSNVAVASFNVDPMQIRAFPNPVSNSLTVSGATPGSTIMLIDMMGRTLKSGFANENGACQLTTGQLQAGTYLLKILAVNGVTTNIKLNK